MAELNLTILDEHQDPVLGLEKSDVTLRHPDNSTIIYDYNSLGEIGYGQYVLWGVNFSERPVRLYINDQLQNWLGIIYAGERDLTYMRKDAPECSADLYMNDNKITNIDDGTASGEAVSYDQLIAEDAALKAYADNKFTDAIDYINEVLSNLPTYSLAQSNRIIRMWQGATDNANKIYNTILKCVQALTLTTYQFATILIEGVTSDSVIAAVGSLEKNNITFKSLNKNWKIAFPDGVKNKSICFEDMTVFFGTGTAGGYAGATRIYTGFKFNNSNVYCYNNLSLYGGEYRNVNFYMASGKTVTFYNAGILDNVKCNSEISFDGSFSGFKDYKDKLGVAFIPGGAMPDDFTISGT